MIFDSFKRQDYKLDTNIYISFENKFNTPVLPCVLPPPVARNIKTEYF